VGHGGVADEVEAPLPPDGAVQRPCRCVPAPHTALLRSDPGRQLLPRTRIQWGKGGCSWQCIMMPMLLQGQPAGTA
jgi:hypothetical protein